MAEHPRSGPLPAPTPGAAGRPVSAGPAGLAATAFAAFALALIPGAALRALAGTDLDVFAFRPQAGILACIIILRPRGERALALAGGFLGCLLAPAAGAPLPAPVFAAAPVLEAWALAALLEAIRGGFAPDDIADLGALAFLCAAVPTAFACAGSAAASAAGSAPFFETARAWAISDALGAVLVIPFGCAAAARPAREMRDARYKLAGAAGIAAAFVLGALWFLPPLPRIEYSFFMLTAHLPFLILAGARFGILGTSAGCLVIFSCASIGTALGGGPLAALPVGRADIQALAGAYSMWFALVPLFNAATIDRRRKAEEETLAAKAAAEEARAVAEKALAVKSEFLSNMSHEIRTPLNGMLGMTALLAGSGLGDRQRGYVDRLQKSGKLLLAIVNDVLDLEKSDSGLKRRRPEATDVAALCDGALASFEGLAAEKGLALESEYSGLDGRLETDPRMLSQILMNLLGNAIKFTERGRVRLEASAEPAAPSEPRGAAVLRLRVSDTGIGIPRSAFELVFERFRQVDSSYSKAQKGTGLGLSIVKRYVDLLGGEIELESEVGRGSSFAIRLPCSRAPAVRDRAAEREGAPADAEERAEPRRSALVVEDNAINMYYIESVLSRAGYEVRAAADGLRALEALAAEVPDIVFMDVQMPGMDGLECARRIRSGAAPRAARAPIVALTGYAGEADKARCAEAGMDWVLAKPVEEADLLAAMTRRYPGRG